MLNNDYLKGYIAALDNIKAYLDTSYKCEYSHDKRDAFKQTLVFINQVKENYKQLVKDLNESQSKKTTP